MKTLSWADPVGKTLTQQLTSEVGYLVSLSKTKLRLGTYSTAYMTGRGHLTKHLATVGLLQGDTLVELKVEAYSERLRLS